MIDVSDFDDITVTISHPWADIDMPLSEWAERGPSKQRPLMTILAAKRRSTGESISLDEIPPEFLNTRTTRQMQREGLLPTPWGPPPDDRPVRPLSRDIPPEIRAQIEQERRR
ncbi:hypothetical protein ACQP2E_22695 [Actinoplanes sp. CA-015351]|uniref:hypothetical protein n=1 Tax=Actinoplanes sp. CA-015351 TaxID=3239897 RepID=UPI003D987E41